MTEIIFFWLRWEYCHFASCTSCCNKQTKHFFFMVDIIGVYFSLISCLAGFSPFDDPETQAASVLPDILPKISANSVPSEKKLKCWRTSSQLCPISFSNDCNSCALFSVVLSTVAPLYNRPNVYTLPLLPNLQLPAKVVDKGSCCLPSVWIQACQACPEGWKDFCLQEIWRSFKERQRVAELGMKTGIPYPADSDLAEEGSTIRKANGLKPLGHRFCWVGGAGCIGRWLRVALWGLLGLTTVKNQTSYTAYCLHMTFPFYCLHHMT